jgi:hypothetical protein
MLQGKEFAEKVFRPLEPVRSFACSFDNGHGRIVSGYAAHAAAPDGSRAADHDPGVVRLHAPAVLLIFFAEGEAQVFMEDITPRQ